jgi:galactokinase
MNTIALPRSAYNEILKRQARVESAISKLQETVEEITYDEIKPSVLKRLEKQSRLLDEGKGIKFKNIKEYRAFVRSL